MNKLRSQLFITSIFIGIGVMNLMAGAITAECSEKSGYEFPNSGVATVLSPSSFEIDDVDTTKESKNNQLNIHEKFDREEERMLAELTMANVSNTLNVRAEANEDSTIVGYLYKDCGGTILEKKDGWTKISSGALTGWCSDEYLLFGDDAVAMAEDVGRWMTTLNTEAVRVRKEPNTDSDVVALFAKSDYADLVEIIDDDWVSIDFEGDLGYVDADYVDLLFHIDTGETKEQVRNRNIIEERIRKAEAEKAAKEAHERAVKEAIGNLTANRGAVDANADEIRLLASLIWCEAGNQSYEGMLGVGAVVMNRVKSPAYPNTIYSVIYASGQFTPAMSGRVARVYESGPSQTCLQAAIEAIQGVTTVGAATHFRRNNGHAGYVLGAHVFW